MSVGIFNKADTYSPLSFSGLNRAAQKVIVSFGHYRFFSHLTDTGTRISDCDVAAVQHTVGRGIDYGQHYVESRFILHKTFSGLIDCIGECDFHRAAIFLKHLHR